jgi:ComF family protein
MSPRLPLLRLALERLASLLSPDTCAACDAPVRTFTVFCPACARSLLPPTVAHEGELAAFAYGGALATAIAALKYRDRPDLARPLSHLLLAAARSLQRDPPDVVVPVPLHADRLARRGYNHAALLAAPVARMLGARFAPNALARIRDTEAQASLGKEARQRNVDLAFVARREIPGQRVLLVDDVRTTGATLGACAAALAAAGAVEVRRLVLATADDPPRVRLG